MQKTDLSLVPLKDLIIEIESRCSTFICAYETFESLDKQGFDMRIGKGLYFKACAMAGILMNHIINNYGGNNDN